MFYVLLFIMHQTNQHASFYNSASPQAKYFLEFHLFKKAN